MTPEKYKPSVVVGKVVKILFLLGNHVVDGLAPTEIADALQINKSNVTHLLAQLYHEGAVEMVQVGKSERWRLAPKMGQIGVGILSEVSRKESNMAEVKNRFTREF